MVPCGVVVFLPSYDYEQTVVKRLASTGQLTEILSKCCDGDSSCSQFDKYNIH